MENLKLLKLDVKELDMAQLIAIDGGHYEASVDRDTAIMIADFFCGVVIGFLSAF